MNKAKFFKKDFLNSLEIDPKVLDENLATFFEILLEWTKPPPE